MFTTLNTTDALIAEQLSAVQRRVIEALESLSSGNRAQVYGWLQAHMQGMSAMAQTAYMEAWLDKVTGLGGVRVWLAYID